MAAWSIALLYSSWSSVEGVQGSLTGIPIFAVLKLLELQFADNLSLLSNVHNQLQTMLNRLRVYAHRKFWRWAQTNLLSDQITVTAKYKTQHINQWLRLRT